MYFRAVDAAFPTRLFSLRDANALVGTLQAHFEHARELRDKLAAVQADLAKAGHPMDRPEVQVDQAAPPGVNRLQRSALAILDDLRSILREVSELGVEVKAADGLVDFRSKLRGRTVYLCWKYGEERVGYFHEMDTGFAGRRPLPDDGDFTGDFLH